MSFEIRPKVICKNLDDIIKESIFSTKRSSIEDAQKWESSQRTLKSEPRQRRSNERCNTSVSRGNRLYESGSRLNTSISKHSLESKEKIKILENKISSNSAKQVCQKKSRHAVLPTSAVEFYPSVSKKPQGTLRHMKSLYFNQVDAILTELEDFIRETREKICSEMDVMNEESLANMLANQLSELSNVFKSELEGLIERSVYVDDESEVLRPKNRGQEGKQMPKNTAKVGSAPKHHRAHGQFQDELIKIEEFMQRQGTIGSTINSEPHEEGYIPTQTDAQLLSMLAYKNKASTKRKLQNVDSYGQELMSPWVKSGRSVNTDAEYSFRNREARENEVFKDIQMKKKKCIKNTAEKSANKENRQKSIYQMVLEENSKLKTDYKR